MKKCLVITAILFWGGAGFLIWANSESDISIYPDPRNYVPDLWFDSEEIYYPVSPLDFYYDADINELSGKDAKKIYDSLSKQEKLDNFKVFYNVENLGSEWVYQYWLFYVFNDATNKHYGDWESVFVFVDKHNEGINSIIASAHNGTKTKVLFSNSERLLPKNYTRIFVEDGSHANCIDKDRDGLFSKTKDNSGTLSYCTIFFSTWSTTDKLHGLKVPHDSPYYDLRPLDEIKDVFGKKYSENTPLLSKEKSPTLGILPMYALGKKFYALPFGGSPPKNAWLKDEYKDPQEVVPMTPKRVAAKVSNKVGQFFTTTKNFAAKTGNSVKNFAAETGKSAVHLAATANIPSAPLSGLDLFGKNTIRPLTLKELAQENVLRGDLIEPEHLLSGDLAGLVARNKENAAKRDFYVENTIANSAQENSVSAAESETESPADTDNSGESDSADSFEGRGPPSQSYAAPSEAYSEGGEGRGGNPEGGDIFFEAQFAPETEVSRVVRVIDGDTIEIQNGRIVRYIGINAPELPNECFAKAATEQNKNLVEGKQLIFIKGPTDEDKYGRLLRFAWTDENSNGLIDSGDIFVNLHLIEGGYAYSYNFGEAHSYDFRFESAERSAKRGRQGLWGDACREEESKTSSSSENGPYKVGSGVAAQPTPNISKDESDDSPLSETEKEGSGSPPPPEGEDGESNVGISDDSDNITDNDENSTTTADSGISDSDTDFTDTSTSTATSTDSQGGIDNFDGQNSTSTSATSTKPMPEPSPIIINEIQLADSEFIELYNNSSSSISLAGYYFSYYSSGKINWNEPHRNKKFPDAAEAPAGGHFLIGLNDFPEAAGNPNANWQAYGSNQLNNSKGTVAIFPFNPQATTSEAAYSGRIDTIGWDSDFDGDDDDIFLYETSPVTSTPAKGESLSRDENHTDSNDNSSDFSVLVSPTPTSSKGETVLKEEPEIGGAPLWQMRQRDAQNSGLAAPLSGPTFSTSTEATTTWIFKMDGGARQSPVVGYDGAVYAVDTSGFVHAIDPADGFLKWKFDPQTDGGDGKGWSGAGVALSNDSTRVYSVYTDTDNSKLILYSIKTKDGSLDWKYLDDGANDGFSPPMIDSVGNVFVTSKGKIYSISPEAALNWAMSVSSIWLQTPAIDKDGFVYVSAKQNSDPRGKYILKINSSNADIAWQENPVGIGLLNALSIDENGTLYTGGNIPTGRSGLYAIDPADGSEIWFSRIGDVGGPVPSFDADGNVYLGVKNSSTSGGLIKVEPNGAIKWSFSSKPSSPIAISSIADSQNRIYIGTQGRAGVKPSIFALDSQTGKEIWHFELEAEPRGSAVGDGVLYVTSEDGKIYAFK